MFKNASVFLGAAWLATAGCGAAGAPAGVGSGVEVLVSNEAKEPSVGALAKATSFTLSGRPATFFSSSPTEPEKTDFGLGEGMTRDGRLDAAATAALEMAEDGRSLTGSAVQEALWFFGVAQTSAATTLVAGSSVEGVLSKLRAWLEAQADKGDDRYGVAVRSGKDGASGVVLSLASRIELEQVRARHGKQGPVRVAGRVSKPYKEPTLIVTSPGGRTKSIPLATKKGGEFDERLELDEKGRWQLEIMAGGPEGPVALVNFPIAVGIPIDPEIVISTSALESKNTRELEQLLFNHLNEARKKHGLESLAWSEPIAKVARGYSAEMAQTGRVAHVSRISGSVADRVKAAGLGLLGVAENLARAGNASEAHAGLMASPGHRENILKPDAESVGIGVVIFEPEKGENPVLIVTQIFSMGRAEALDDMGPAEILERVNAARKKKGLAPLKMDEKLARQGRASADACFEPNARRGELVLGRYRSVAAVRLMTNDLREETFARTAPVMAPHVRDVGVAVARGESPDTGALVLCITLLLGER